MTGTGRKRPAPKRAPRRPTKQAGIERRRAVDLLVDLWALSQRINALVHRSGGGGLSFNQFAVLEQLSRAPEGETPARLAARLGLAKATMTNIVGKLRDGHLVQTEENPTDRRSKLVFLTTRGRSARTSILASLDPLLKTLTDKDAASPEPADAPTNPLATLHALMAKLRSQRD